MSLLSANHVQHILQKALGATQRELTQTPTHILQAGSDMLQRKISSQDPNFKNVLHSAYYATGNTWGLDDSEFPWDAYMASGSLYATLLSIGELDPFKNIRCPQTSDKSKDIIVEAGHCLDEKFVDDDIDDPIVGVIDAASAACRAYSWTHESFTFQPKYDLLKRQEFWEWWLVEAVAIAWKLASRGSTKQDKD